MKTYLLREPQTVEPQNVRRPGRQRATTRAILGGSAAPAPHGPVLFIGLDVHTDSIAVSLAPSDSAEVRRYGLIGGTHDDLLRLAKKLQAAHPDSALRFCYEAGPHGYPLGRCLRAHGYDCILVAPSKIPRAPGDRVKTNRRDVAPLADLFVVQAVDGFVSPDGAEAGGGQRGGVQVIGFGVEGEEGEGAGAAVNVNFHAVQAGCFPADIGVAGLMIPRTPSGSSDLAPRAARKPRVNRSIRQAGETLDRSDES